MLTDELREWCIGHASVAIECALQTLSEEQGALAAAAAYDDIAPQIREVYAARIAELEGALEPFAEAADNLDDEADGAELWEHPAAIVLTAGHLRKAAAALATLKGADHDAS